MPAWKYRIPAADIEKIFDPFYTSNFTGRGLGLPTVLEARDGVHSEWPQAFLGKPYKAKDLREAIVRILANPTEASMS